MQAWPWLQLLPQPGSWWALSLRWSLRATAVALPLSEGHVVSWGTQEPRRPLAPVCLPGPPLLSGGQLWSQRCGPRPGGNCCRTRASGLWPLVLSPERTGTARALRAACQDLFRPHWTWDGSGCRLYSRSACGAAGPQEPGRWCCIRLTALVNVLIAQPQRHLFSRLPGVWLRCKDIDGIDT